MAVAYFESQEAPFPQSSVGNGNKTAVDVETVRASEQGGVWFVLDYLRLHGGGIVCRDVRRVGKDGVEAKSACDCCFDARKQIRVDELDALVATVREGVLTGDGDRGVRYVRSDKACSGEMGGERDNDSSGACSYIGDLERLFGLELSCPEQDCFHEVLGFGARDEDGRCDAEVQAVELLLAGDVLQRFSSGATIDHALESVCLS